jgi:hypothetical protein
MINYCYNDDDDGGGGDDDDDDDFVSFYALSIFFSGIQTTILLSNYKK